MIFVQAVGLINAMGAGAEAVRANLSAGLSPGMQWAAELMYDGRPVLVGRVLSDLPPMPPAYARSDCRNNRLLLAALEQIRPAVDAALECYGRERVAIVLGTSTAGIAEGEAALDALNRSGQLPPAYDYHQQELGSPSDWLARFLGTTGPAYTVSTACSSSARAFISARRLLDAGFADAVIVAGADSLCRLTVNGFSGLESVSKGRCQPFCTGRDGINIGEAAALMLLSREPAPVALLGVGESSDAHHISAPQPEGEGAEAAMCAALADAGLTPADIGYINLHGTATPLNDSMEALAVSRVFGAAVPCSSTKPLTGHTLGAAGATEAALCWLLLTGDGVLPAQISDAEPDLSLPAIGLLRAPQALARPVVLSNSFAFGGNNVSLIFGRIGHD